MTSSASGAAALMVLRSRSSVGRNFAGTCAMYSSTVLGVSGGRGFIAVEPGRDVFDVPAGGLDPAAVPWWIIEMLVGLVAFGLGVAIVVATTVDTFSAPPRSARFPYSSRALCLVVQVQHRVGNSLLHWRFSRLVLLD